MLGKSLELGGSNPRKAVRDNRANRCSQCSGRFLTRFPVRFSMTTTRRLASQDQAGLRWVRRARSNRGKRNISYCGDSVEWAILTQAIAQVVEQRIVKPESSSNDGLLRAEGRPCKTNSRRRKKLCAVLGKRRTAYSRL